MVPSMDYTREHVKICLNSIINAEQDLYLIFGEELKKNILNGSDLLVDHQEDVVMVPSMDYTREHVKIYFNSIINVAHVLYLIFVEEFQKKKNFKWIRPLGGPPGGRCNGPLHGLHQGAHQNMFKFYNQCGT